MKKTALTFCAAVMAVTGVAEAPAAVFAPDAALIKLKSTASDVRQVGGRGGFYGGDGYYRRGFYRGRGGGLRADTIMGFGYPAQPLSPGQLSVVHLPGSGSPNTGRGTASPAAPIPSTAAPMSSIADRMSFINVRTRSTTTPIGHATPGARTASVGARVATSAFAAGSP